MQISETTFTVSGSGSLKIPAALLREMGLFPGDHVRVAYLTQDGQWNNYREFFLSSASLDETDDGHLLIPESLLKQAGISESSDVQIICVDGAIVVAYEDALSSKELKDVLDGLTYAVQIADQISDNPVSAIQELQEICSAIEKEDS